MVTNIRISPAAVKHLTKESPSKRRCKAVGYSCGAPCGNLRAFPRIGDRADGAYLAGMQARPRIPGPLAVGAGNHPMAGVELDAALRRFDSPRASRHTVHRIRPAVVRPLPAARLCRTRCGLLPCPPAGRAFAAVVLPDFARALGLSCRHTQSRRARCRRPPPFG